MTMPDLEGRTFGPKGLAVTADRVGAYLEATGDQVDRWVDHAPPGFASAALFAVAPDLLALLAGRSVVHGEQTFDWQRPLQIGASLDVVGTVTRFRERGGVVYVSFDLTAGDASGEFMRGTSLFLLSGEAPPLDSEPVEHEPAHDDDGAPGSGERSASRATLVRYAAATGDWNPVHWDHDAAVGAGFPGVVVHGLLQAAWALQAASAYRAGPHPVRAARFRFRAPLPPARPVEVKGEAAAEVVSVAVTDSTQEYLSARIELADE